MARLRLVVIGASAGGVEPLRQVISALPADLPAAVLVVLHVAPYQASSLPQILARVGKLPAVHPRDGAKLQAGRIYVAPPDHHMLVEDNHVAVTKGPKENRFRPSIDALFRSAAYTAGPSTIGVILSGALDDGTSGLWSVKRMGGVAIVQRPTEAQMDSMPLSALQQVKVDHEVAAGEIGPLLVKLLKAPTRRRPRVPKALERRLGIEVAIAAKNEAFQKGVLGLGELTSFTCPECHGALARIPELKMARYRCHTGHAYTDSSLLEGVMEATGELLYQVVRSYEEAVLLLRDMATHLKAGGDAERAKPFEQKAKDLQSRSEALHKAMLDHESLSGDNLGQTPRKPGRG